MHASSKTHKEDFSVAPEAQAASLWWSPHLLPSLMARRWRQGNDAAVNVSALADDLSSFARDKQCPFDFDLLSYAKHKRSQAADREGLIKYKPLLATILKHAPGGRPSLVALRECWQYLERTYSIRKDNPGINNLGITDWANQAADRIRVALKHVMDLKESQSPWMAPDLKELTELLQPSTGSASSLASGSASSLAPPSPASPTPRTLRKEDSLDSVIFCSACCKCPDCYTAPVLPVPSSPEDLSQTSMDASAMTEAPPCGNGAAARAVQSKAKAKKIAASKFEGIKVVTRKKPGKEGAYILKNKVYVVSCPLSRCKRFKEAIEAVAELLKKNPCMSKEAAKDALASWIDRNGG